MNGAEPWQEELSALCEAVIEEQLTEEQRQRLEQLVLDQPAARRYYVEYLHQHACLHWSGANAEIAAPSPRLVHTADPTKLRKRFSVRRVVISALVAASVLVALVVWYGRPVEEGRHLATLTSSRACRWDGGTLPTEEGAQLGAGRLRLAEGVAVSSSPMVPR